MLRPLTLAALLVCLAGCGGASDEGPELVPVTGSVELGGEPLAGADVRLVPTGETEGVGGEGRTGEDGSFEIRYRRGGEGVPAGEYKVVVSRRLMPDGTPVPEDDDTPPIESPARESLPPRYSSEEQTELTASVGPEAEPIELTLDK